MLLTETQIKKAKPKEKQYKLRDGDGLFLVVLPNGNKFWHFRYKFNNRESTISFGKYPIVGVAEARSKRLEHKKVLNEGLNPSRSRKRGTTFREIALEWHERNLATWTDKNARLVKGRLENHIFPHIGNIDIRKLKPLQILQVINLVDKDHPEAARRTLQNVSRIFRYAIINQIIEVDPSYRLSEALRPRIKSELPTIRPSELPEFIETLEAFPVSDELFRLALKATLLTFLRSGSLRTLKWVYIEGDSIHVPAEYMKMKDDFLVPISSQLRSVISSLREINGDKEYLFAKEGTYLHENSINNLIHKMGYKGRMVGHGCRKLASTMLNEHGFNRDAIEKQLSHENRSIRAIYNKAEYLPERIKMMQWWGDELEQLGLKV